MSVVLCYGQSTTHKFSTIDIMSGLPNNFINAIEMDSLGFLWIGTIDGLCRYDSPNQIEVYKTGQLGLESSHVTSIKAGENNKLWVGTSFGGVTMYDIMADTSRTYNVASEDKYLLSSNEVLDLCEIDSTEIWIGTENGLNVLYPENDSIYQFPISANDVSKLNAKAILDIHRDKNGWIWIGTWDGSFYLYTPSKSGRHDEGKFRKLLISDDSSVTSIWKIFQDSRGLYWIATHNGGAHVMILPENASNDPKEQNWLPTFHSYAQDLENYATSLTSNYVQDFEEDDFGNIWIPTTHGLNIASASEIESFLKPNSTKSTVELKFQRYHQNASKNSLANSLTRRAFKDKQGIMWIGTISGLNQYNWYTNQFEIVTLPTSTKEEINEADQLINSIHLQDKNTLLLASDINGLITYDLKNNRLQAKRTYSNPKIHNSISTIAEVEDKLLLGTNTGISVYDEKTKSIFDLEFPQTDHIQNSNIYITRILKDFKNRIWVGTEKGLVMIDEEEKKSNWFLNSVEDSTSISDNSITHIFEDSQKNIWISTFNGINLLEENNDSLSFKNFKRNKLDTIIPSNKVTAINEYNGIIYFGCRNGIFTYDLKGNVFKTLDIKKNKYTINSIQISKQGVIWASTSEGVLRYEINSKDFKLFGKNDGVGDLSFRASSGYISDNSDVYFGGNKGFIRINDSELQKNITKPDVHITHIKTIDTDSQHSISGIKKETITLPSNNYYLAINFTALNYNQPEYNQYKYKLIGFSDEGWQTTNSQQAVYTNLDAGEYTFKVIASNNEGIWNEEGVTLDIIVKAALVKTLWFKIGIFLLSLLIARIGFLLYTRNIRKKNDVLEGYNEKLNAQIQKTEAANMSLEEREKDMKVILKKLELSNQELLRSNKDLEEFAYAASHDMKEPLRTVGTFTNLLNKKYNDQIGESGKEYIQFITQGVQRMSSLINSLLNYSQVGKKDLEFQQSDLNEIVNAKIEDLSQIIYDKNAKVICSELPTILCAGTQIGMVFYNLILNGIKFNKSYNPTIEVSAIENATYWKFMVKDNGIGIKNQYQKQIFEIFKRLHNRNEYEGTGIGLALCNKIVLRHNGKISVESEPNKGTTFKFTISKTIKFSEDTQEPTASNGKHVNGLQKTTKKSTSDVHNIC